MASNTTEHSRRAVYAAVSRVFQDRMAQQQAMDFWENKFSSETVFHVSDFAAKLRNHVGLNDDQRRELMVSIFSALSKPESQLAPVPAVLQVSHGSPVNDMEAPAAKDNTPPAPVAKNRKDPANVVFSNLLTTFVSTVASKHRSARGELQEVFIDLLAEMSVDANISRRFAKWAQVGFEDTNVPEVKDPRNMSEVVNTLYVALCDIAGPVVTDNALAKAVSTTNELPESQDFSASSLL